MVRWSHPNPHCSEMGWQEGLEHGRSVFSFPDGAQDSHMKSEILAVEGPHRSSLPSYLKALAKVYDLTAAQRQCSQ